MYYLYALEAKSALLGDTPEVRYIGMTTQKMGTRLIEHKSEAREGKKDSHTYKNKWIRSLWKKGDDVVITKIKECTSFEELKKEEKLFIKLCRVMAPEWKLTNGTEGGDGTLGFKHSDKQRKANSLRQIGSISKSKKRVINQFGTIYFSITEAAKESNLCPSEVVKVCKQEGLTVKGFTFWYLDSNGEKSPKKDRNKRIESGFKMNEEQKRKVRDFLSKPLVDNFGNVWASAREAGRCLGLNHSGITKTCKGVQKHTRGFTFQYLEINA